MSFPSAILHLSILTTLSVEPSAAKESFIIAVSCCTSFNPVRFETSTKILDKMRKVILNCTCRYCEVSNCTIILADQLLHHVLTSACAFVTAVRDLLLKIFIH
jgi:hypothetical protein